MAILQKPNAVLNAISSALQRSKGRPATTETQHSLSLPD
jgi:hypothetical protein